MPTLTFAQLAAMTGGEVLSHPELETTSVVIDPREVKPGSVFFAIKGERFDGHQFVAAALETAAGAEVVVSEMGMNHKGEIAQLAGLTRPDVGVYTNIGPVHIEFFGTIEKIAEAKKELLENVKPEGVVVVNTDNEHVVRIARDF